MVKEWIKNFKSGLIGIFGTICFILIDWHILGREKK